MKKAVDKKVFLISVLFLFLIMSAFLVSAAPIDVIRGWFSNINFDAENFKLYSVQILFLILVSLIIFAISDFVPFLSGSDDKLRFAVSIIIAILSIMYLTPQELYTALQGYKALGIVLTTFIPFIILMIFTLRWNTRHPEYSIISTFIWIAYVVAYFIKYYESFLAFLYGQPDPNGIGGFGLMFIGLTGFLSLAMIFFGGYIARRLFYARLRGLIVKGNLKDEAYITGRINEIRHMITTTPELADEYEQMIKDLERARKKIKREDSFLGQGI
ncbi:MAG: hypothetical protein AABX16_01130 [Nanoarchaeota archaeon]